MLRWSLAFFAVALVAAVFGFTDLAAGAAWVGKMLFFLFIACFVLFLVAGARRRRRRVVVVRVRNHAEAPRR